MKTREKTLTAKRSLPHNLLLYALALCALWLCAPACGSAGVVRGRVCSQQTGEPLVGAAVMVQGRKAPVLTDAQGSYLLSLPHGEHILRASLIGYRPQQLTAVVRSSRQTDTLTLDFQLAEAGQLSEAQVVAHARRGTESALVVQQRQALVVQSGIGSAQIAKTGDRDGAEVVKRVPGVSIIEDRFVLVRGLSQRYNNVWLNGSAVPSSEADSRAFSFDILPSGQLENVAIVKSPAPEYPADFTGGFILVSTKRFSAPQGLTLSLGTGLGTRTHLSGHRQLRAAGSATDFLGFDGGERSLPGGIGGTLTPYAGASTAGEPMLNPWQSGLSGDWTAHRHTPLPDLRLGATYARSWATPRGGEVGLNAALNYSNTHTTLLDMENSLYGPYDLAHHEPVYLRKATDQRYQQDARLGVMLNLALRPSPTARSTYEWQNVLNQLGRDRLTQRQGFNAQPDSLSETELYYSSRTTYATQFAGHHRALGPSDLDRLDWSLGYAFAGRSLPDRRRMERTDRSGEMGLQRVSREWTQLREHTASASASYQRTLPFLPALNGAKGATLRTGLYAEHRTRAYHARELQLGWLPQNRLQPGFEHSEDLPRLLSDPANYGTDALYFYEEVNLLNDYTARSTQGAAYLGLNLPVGPVSLYLGARYERLHQVLGMNTQRHQASRRNTPYNYSDLFPSLNLTWRLTPEQAPHGTQQLRLAYGRSTNRPELRELSTSVYYDFELGSNVMGNADLQAAYIDNFDLRYEWYPHQGEALSVAVFYKRFRHPIEWTYTVAGGTDLIYSYLNAHAADNYGVEVELRRSLAFLGLPCLSLALNGAWIKSSVRFPQGTNNLDRPMQGQSPYLINAGIFYQQGPWNASAVYNRIGRRIIGVGNRYGTAADGTARNIPSSYELPRHGLDLALSRQLGHWKLALSVRDALSQRYRFVQREKLTDPGTGKQSQVEELTSSYRPGTNLQLTASYSF